MHHTGIEISPHGADEVRRYGRLVIREGVDTVKINISGDNFVRTKFGRQTSYSEAEVAAAAEGRMSGGLWLACHARAAPR